MTSVRSVEAADELAALRASVRGYLERHVSPLVAEHERSRTFPWEVVPELHQFGYVTGLVPAADGGDEISFTALAILMEEAGRCWGSLRTTLNVLTIAPYILAAEATTEQKRRFLDRLLAGESRSWIGITESEAGSDVAAMRTVARLDGDDYVLSGHKLYVTNAATNDIGIVLAVTDSDAGANGITAFIVDRAESPYETFPIEHMSVRATNNCEVVFDEVRVSRSNVLGPVGRGLGVAMRAVNIGRLNMAMGAIGIAEAALDIATSHVTERRQFGRVLANFQLVQKLIVDAAVDIEAGRQLGLYAASVLDGGQTGRQECSMAKYFCSEAAMRAVTNAMQACGGAGLMDEMQIERMFRDVREASIPEGTSELQILNIGKALLGVSALR